MRGTIMKHLAGALAFAALGFLSVAAGDFYVSTTGDDANPGTEQQPFKTIAAALASARSAAADSESAATIHIADGEYAEYGLALDFAVTVAGNATDNSAVTVSGDDNLGGSVFRISHPLATLRDLSVKNGYGKGNTFAEGAGGNVGITGGLVTNCRLLRGRTDRIGGSTILRIWGGRVEDCLVDASPADDWHRGVSVYMDGGVVTRCKITGGSPNRGDIYAMSGSGAHVRGGVIENCLLTGNTAALGTLCLAGGTAVNCTIAGNSLHTGLTQREDWCAGVRIATASSAAINCLVFDNGGTEQLERSASMAPENTTNYGDGNSARFINCASTVANASGVNWVTLPSADWRVNFKDTADYVPVPGSLLVDVGDATLYSDIAWSDVDISGETRTQGSGIDIGCRETGGDFACFGVVMSAPSVGQGGAIAFAGFSSGTAGEAVYEWDFGDGSPNLVTTETSFNRTFPDPGTFIVRVRAKETDGAGFTGWERVLESVNVFPTDVYVSTTGDDANPGTEKLPFRTIAAALASLRAAAADSDIAAVIHIADGTYVETEPLMLDFPVVVEGNQADRTAVVIDDDNGSAGGNMTIRAFALNHANAVLRNLTVKNGYGTGEKFDDGTGNGAGANVGIMAGLVSNCWLVASSRVDSYGRGASVHTWGGSVVDCLIERPVGLAHNWGEGCGALVYMEGGVVSRCKITGGRISRSDVYATKGVGAYVVSDVIENCLLTGNTPARGTLYLAGAGATAVNCTVAGNRLHTSLTQREDWCAGVVIDSPSASAVNCLVFDNGGTEQLERSVRIGNVPATEYHEGNGARFFNCASTVANPSGVNWVTLPSADWRDYFKDTSGWVPLKRTPLMNAGDKERYGYIVSTTVDFAGASRVQNSKIDIGCHEIGAGNGLSIVIR